MCKIDGCNRVPVAKGLCAKHYLRLRRTGDASLVRKTGPKKECFEADGPRVNLDGRPCAPLHARRGDHSRQHGRC
jgi:hypothetical protein